MKDEQPPKKNRFSFRLRSLLIVTTLIAVICMFVGNKLYRDHLETRAVEALKKAQVKVEEVEGRVTRAYLSGDYTDRQIEELAVHLGNLRMLKEVDFVRIPLEDGDVHSLRHLTNVKIIYVFETSLTEKGIEDLRKLLPEAIVRTDEPDPIASGMSAAIIYPHAMVTVAWSPDGSLMATGSGDGTVRVWDMESLYPVDEWKAHGKWAFAVEFSPDGKMIATGGGDNVIRIWDAGTLELVTELTGHMDDVHAVGYTPDGNVLVSASDDRTIRVWDLKQKKSLHVLTGHTAQIPSLDVSPDGRLIASSSRDETVRIWELATGNSLHVFEGHDDDVMSVAFDPQSKLLASGGNGGEIKILDMDNFEVQQSFSTDEDQVYRLAFNSTSESIAASGDTGVSIRDLSTGTNRRFAPQERVASVSFNPVNDLLASTNANGELHLLDPETLDTSRILRTMFGERGLEFPAESNSDRTR